MKSLLSTLLLFTITLCRASSLDLLFEKAAAGDTQATFTLAQRYETGNGVEKNLPLAICLYDCAYYNREDYPAAYHKCETLRQQLRDLYTHSTHSTDDALDIYEQARAYHYGEGGTPQDIGKAIALYQTAFYQGVPWAIEKLAFCYLEDGPHQNWTKARHTLLLAVALGDDGAIRLGEIYENGYNVEKHIPLAILFYTLCFKTCNDLEMWFPAVSLIQLYTRHPTLPNREAQILRFAEMGAVNPIPEARHELAQYLLKCNLPSTSQFAQELLAPSPTRAVSHEDE